MSIFLVILCISIRLPKKPTRITRGILAQTCKLWKRLWNRISTRRIFTLQLDLRGFLPTLSMILLSICWERSPLTSNSIIRKILRCATMKRLVFGKYPEKIGLEKHIGVENLKTFAIKLGVQSVWICFIF